MHIVNNDIIYIIKIRINNNEINISNKIDNKKIL